MKNLWLKTSLALAIGAVSTHSLGNGIAINEQSVSGMGTSFAGRASTVNDASVLYGNPAGLSKLKRAEVTGGLSFIDASTDINNASSSTAEGDMVPFAAVPFGYFASPIDDKWSWGLGFYVPYALMSDYEKSFGGRFKGLTSKVEVTTLQPTLSYRFNDRVSVGFGPTINKIKGTLINRLNNAAIGGTDETKVGIKGDDVAYGFNAGVMVDVTDQLTWGLTYHSKVDYSLEGRTKISGVNSLLAPAFAGLNNSYDASLDITLPESADTSISYKLDDQWTLYGGATWTRWSRLDAIVVENEGTPTLPVVGNAFASIDEELKWHDTWSYSIGASYQLNPQWVLRTGLAIDPSPAENAHRTVRIPVGNRKVFSLGAGWSPSQDLTIDVAYSYLHESKSSVNQEGNSLTPGFSADYRNSAHAVGAQATYRF